MMSGHYMECHTLPTINEIFPQFSARPPLPPPLSQQQHPPPPLSALRTTGIARALDLSLRAGVNIVPITPPSTPSPPRKRSRFMSDEHYLWRPHVMGTTPAATETTSNINTVTSNTGTAEHRNSNSNSNSNNNNHFLHTMTYTRREELTSYTLEEEGYNNDTTTTTHSFIDNNTTINSFEEIPKSQRSGNLLMIEEYQQQQQRQQRQHQQQQLRHQQQHHRNMSTIYVDDETIVLTEDENDEDDEDGDGEDELEEEEEAVVTEDRDDMIEDDEENETLVSSQEFNEDDVELADDSNEAHNLQKSPQTSNNDEMNSPVPPDDDEDEEVYVDILSNDDDDDINPLSGRAITMLRLQSQTDLEQELEKTGQILTRNKLVYENEELHNRAVDGLAKLFNRDFHKRQHDDEVVVVAATTASSENMDKEKTYIDLTNCPKTKENPYVISPARHDKGQQQFMISPNIPSCSTSSSSSRPPYKTHKSERKRMKLRKHMSVDEETISPVSGTIIRKLRDDEELVVRKGDIDPAFNVVEVTEEAKAILASIDNKIGDYLCQLCRSVYDDAFKLAQHRCPRIVHIEYKCSECEKVFNCPANLASHRRWHKPKSELLANSQAKKRPHPDRNSQVNANTPDKHIGDDGIDGIFPCNQCGKTFRRHAYLKKHQASHQMLENLKSLDIFKNSTTHTPTFPPSSSSHLGNHAIPTPPRVQPNAIYPPLQQHARPYSSRFGGFPFPTPFDHRRFYTLGEFYLSQQLERSSAFQYVQANHLRNLSNVAGNFVNRPVVPSPIIPLPVK